MSTSPLDLSLEAFQARQAAGARLTLLDVREDWEWRLVHLPEAMHIPLGELEERIDELPAEGELVVYCHHGIRSRHAALLLRESGREAVSLAGGIDLYARAIDPSLPLY